MPRFLQIKLSSLDSRGQSVCKVVLYDGDVLVRFAADLFAVPVRALWETPAPPPR